jgi:hypothetical protein
LLLYIEQHEYVGALSESAGARVTIHRHDQQPFPDSHGFNVLPGVQTRVGVRVVSRLGVGGAAFLFVLLLYH